MKKYLLSLLVFQLFLGAYNLTGDFEITTWVNDPSLDGNKVFFIRGKDTIVSTVRKGFCCFREKMNHIPVGSLKIEGRDGQVDLLLEACAHITVKVEKEGVSCSDHGLNDCWNQYKKEREEIIRSGESTLKKLEEEGMDHEALNDAMNETLRMQKKLWQYTVLRNCENLVGAEVLAENIDDVFSLDEIRQFTEQVKYAGLFPEIGRRQQFFENRKKMTEGQLFVDFKGVCPDGKVVALSDYVGKGKYVILDFWASWCGPCRASIPRLKEVYDALGGDRFTVVGINVSERRFQDFKNAIKSDEVNYPQIYTKGDEATFLYGIQGIPMIMLLDPDGKILRKDLLNENIMEVVRGYL